MFSGYGADRALVRASLRDAGLSLDDIEVLASALRRAAADGESAPRGRGDLPRRCCDLAFRSACACSREGERGICSSGSRPPAALTPLRDAERTPIRSLSLARRRPPREARATANAAVNPHTPLGDKLLNAGKGPPSPPASAPANGAAAAAAAANGHGGDNNPATWDETTLHRIVAHFLRRRFPILLALNKARANIVRWRLARGHRLLGKKCGNKFHRWRRVSILLARDVNQGRHARRGRARRARASGAPARAYRAVVCRGGGVPPPPLCDPPLE